MARILIVDDEPSILNIMSNLLQSEGYEVTSAEGGEAGKHHVLSEEFDLMISDIRMNPINGMELLEIAHEHRPNMSVIMLTAYGQVDTAIRALELGAFDYIKKPFKTPELLETVKKALDAHNYMQESS